jgi:hypothetical protein
VCRQLRTEFLPLFLNTLCVRLVEAERFIAYFILMEIEAPINLLVTLSSHEGPAIDILPLFRSATRSNTLTVRFQCEGRGSGLAGTLSRVVSKEKRRWQAVACHLSNVYLESQHERLTIIFTSTPRKWLDERRTCPCTRNVWKKLGFKKPDSFYGYILANGGTHGIHWQDLRKSHIRRRYRLSLDHDGNVN